MKQTLVRNTGLRCEDTSLGHGCRRRGLYFRHAMGCINCNVQYSVAVSMF